MLHAREDYQHIQDPKGIIPEDEPVLLLRGQDVFAAPTARYWAEEAELSQKVDPKMIALVRDLADKMDNWPKKKVPDLKEIN